MKYHMPMFTAILMNLAILFSNAAAQSADYRTTFTGNELLDRCQSLPAACLGYIGGVMDAFAIGRGSEPWKTDISYCLPWGVTFQQVRDIVVKYIEEREKSRHRNASTMVIYALSEAFRCTPKP
jgi:hypothetical protein